MSRCCCWFDACGLWCGCVVGVVVVALAVAVVLSLFPTSFSAMMVPESSPARATVPGKSKGLHAPLMAELTKQIPLGETAGWSVRQTCCGATELLLLLLLLVLLFVVVVVVVVVVGVGVVVFGLGSCCWPHGKGQKLGSCALYCSCV